MLAFRLSRPGLQCFACSRLIRSFTAFSPVFEKPLPARRTISEDEITESFLKGTGPGGQKINKTSSAVQLKHLPTGIVVKHQGTRSRDQNRKVARRLLSERLEELEKGDQSRTALKAERKRVKKASGDKKKKRKYKKLDEEKAASQGWAQTSSSGDAVAAGLLLASDDVGGTGGPGINDTIVTSDGDETLDNGGLVDDIDADEEEDLFTDDEDDDKDIDDHDHDDLDSSPGDLDGGDISDYYGF